MASVKGPFQLPRTVPSVTFPSRADLQKHLQQRLTTIQAQKQAQSILTELRAIGQQPIRELRSLTALSSPSLVATLWQDVALRERVLECISGNRQELPNKLLDHEQTRQLLSHTSENDRNVVRRIFALKGLTVAIDLLENSAVERELRQLVTFFEPFPIEQLQLLRVLSIPGLESSKTVSLLAQGLEKSVSLYWLKGVMSDLIKGGGNNENEESLIMKVKKSSKPSWLPCPKFQLFPHFNIPLISIPSVLLRK